MQERHETDYCSQVDGKMHACGHDAHTAMLIGAAQTLAARRDALRGEIRFCFQPGEETGKGAEDFLAAGDPDRLPPEDCGVRREIVQSWRRSLLSSTQLSTYFVGYQEVAAIAGLRYEPYRLEDYAALEPAAPAAIEHLRSAAAGEPRRARRRGPGRRRAAGRRGRRRAGRRGRG